MGGGGRDVGDVCDGGRGSVCVCVCRWEGEVC